MRDEMRGRRQNMPRRSVIALKPHDLRAGKILFEAQDVVDISAAPSVDRLIVIATQQMLRCGRSK